MAQDSFYVDSCIWLNLFKKEGDSTKGVPYWKIAEDFVNKVMFSDDKEIIYFILVTRDHDLIEFAKDYIEVQKPENLIS